MVISTDITHASVDICTKCQLRCKSCSTSAGLIRNGFVGEGLMSFENFKRIIDMNPQISHIELSNWGEIFLNPDIEAILRYAFNKGVSLYCANGSNFNYVPDNVLEALVKYQMKCLNLSIDGATQETYEQYRVNGHLDKVLDNIRKLNHYKELYGSKYPKLSWQFILFGHNEHEIESVKSLCKELGMVFNPKMNHSFFSPIKDEEYVKEHTGLDYASRKEYAKKYGTDYKHPCYQCIFSPQINWNGDVLGCCVNKWKGLGNVFSKPLADVLNSELYRFMIEVLYGRAKANDSIPCFFCPNLHKVELQPLTDEGLIKYGSYVPVALRK